MNPRLFLLLLAALAGFAAPAAASGLEQLKAFLAEARSAKGTFFQSVTAKSGRKPQQSTGSFALQRPGKFRWAYERPYPQLLVGDGEKLWSYDPDLNQVTVKKLGNALGATPAALLAGEALERNFELKEGEAAEGLEFVEATPKAKESTFVSLRLGLRDNQPQLMEIHDHFGQTTLLRFTHFELNPSLAAGTFRFVPPKGADVVGE
ncbi:MAG TPA: outer membrane lipoprotein chaperone LolA [Rhodocyclaceae bacterium]